MNEMFGYAMGWGFIVLGAISGTLWVWFVGAFFIFATYMERQSP